MLSTLVLIVADAFSFAVAFIVYVAQVVAVAIVIVVIIAVIALSDSTLSQVNFFTGTNC